MNDNTSLLKMISNLNNKIERLERNTPTNAALQVTARANQPLDTTFTNYLIWNIQDCTIFNDGILAIPAEIADVYGDAYNFKIMSEGLYSITLDGFVLPSIQDLQVRLFVGEHDDCYGYLTNVAKQTNCFGFTPRTGFSVTMKHYFKEDDCFSIVLLPSANTTLQRRSLSQNYVSPVLTVAQLTGAYPTPAEPNEWYTNYSQPLP